MFASPSHRTLAGLICILVMGVLIAPNARPPQVSAKAPSAPLAKPCESYVWQPNMIQIGADIACKGPLGENLGFDGTGVVVGSIDTGVDISQPNSNLASNYKCAATPGNQSLCWSDPVTPSPSASPADNFVGDAYGKYIHHGTSAMSVAVGKNGWGVAPGANWITCRGYKMGNTAQEVHPPAAIKACLDWYIQLQPDVMFASLPLTETMDQEITNKLNTLVSLNVVVVVSTGNEADHVYQNTQSKCNSMTLPALNPNVISVGNVYRQGDTLGTMDTIYGTSGRGGSISSLNKPDLVAPGTKITSPIDPSTIYWQGWDGTSMSTPHVAGVAALMLSAKPTLTPAQVKAILQGTAKHISDPTCGTNPSTPNANPIYGWGRLQAAPAVMSLTAPTTGVSAAIQNCTGMSAVIKGGRYWYRANSNAIWQTALLAGSYNLSSGGPPTSDIDTTYINRFTNPNTEVVIDTDTTTSPNIAYVWTRPLPCGGTPGAWTKTTLSAYYGGSNYAALNGPTANIDAAYAANNGDVTIIKGDRYWFRPSSGIWSSNTLATAYYTSPNAATVNIPTSNIDTAYIDINGYYTVISGSQYWYRTSSSANWYTNTLNSAYYGQPFIP